MKYLWFMGENIHVIIGRSKTIGKNVSVFVWNITPSSFETIPDNAIICDSDGKKLTKDEMTYIIQCADAWEFEVSK